MARYLRTQPQKSIDNGFNIWIQTIVAAVPINNKLVKVSLIKSKTIRIQSPLYNTFNINIYGSITPTLPNKSSLLSLMGVG